MKIEFPLWLVTDPNQFEGLTDICPRFDNFGQMERFIEATMCPDGALYTTEAEALADAQARLDARDGSTWVPLSELRPGAVFETRGDVLAAKSACYYDNGACKCILLASGEWAQFHNATLVRERKV